MYSPADRPSSTRAAPAKKRRLSAQTGISSRAAGRGFPAFPDPIRAPPGLLDDRGEPEQQLRALLRGRVAPLRPRPLRSLHGTVDVLLRSARNLGDRLARRRAQDVHGAAVDGVDPLAADQILMVGNRDAHTPPSLSA